MPSPRASLAAVALLALALPAPGRAAEVDKFLLDDTDGVITFNVRHLADSAIFKKNYQPLVQKLLKGLPDVQAQLKDLGLDPLRDVDRVLLVHGESCHRLDGKDAGGMGGLFVVVRGKFDPAKFQAKAAALKLKPHKSPAGVAYEIEVGRSSYFVGMPDKTCVVGSPFKDLVQDALDKGAGKKKTQLKHKDMLALVQKADVKQSLWLAATGRMIYEVQPPKGTGKPTPLTLASAGIEEISGGITVADEVKSAFAAIFSDEERAKEAAGSLQQDLNDLLERVFEAAGKDKKLDPLREFLRTLAITAKGKNLTLEGEVAGKVFEDSVKP